MSSRVALLCAEDDISAAVANALTTRFGAISILVEGRESKKLFLKRRIKRLGLIPVLGQMAFVAAAVPLLRRRSADRIAQIVAQGGLDTSREIFSSARRVTSVNSPEAIAWLRQLNPAVVVVNGTRIISRRVLEAVDARFINTHCGITPEYRGSHGGYWSLARDDQARCGVTVHLVDSGIDTGGILAQRAITPSPEDNFVTYPYLQIAAALPLLAEQVGMALRDAVLPVARSGESGLWYHPTLWQYVATGLRKGVW